MINAPLDSAQFERRIITEIRGRIIWLK